MNKKIFALLLLCAGFVFWWSGSVTSGFHFMDDHGLVRTDSELENRSFISVALNMMSNDMNIRFRPFDRFRTVAETWAFGINFLHHAIFRFVLAFVSLCFFAVFWSALLKNYWLGAFFSIFTIFGPQATGLPLDEIHALKNRRGQ